MSVSASDPLELVGQDLAAAHIEWGRPAGTASRPPRDGLVVTPRDIDLLAALHDYGYLTTRLAGLLFWGSESTAVRRRMRRLHDHALIDRLRPSSRHEKGTREWIYRLSKLGWQYLKQADRAADAEDYTPALIGSISYVEHDLQVVALITRIARQSIATAPLSDQGLLRQIPFSWLGPRRGRVDPRTDRRAEPMSEGARIPTGWSVHAESSRRGTIIPDATLVGPEQASGHTTAVMIEYDRTRRPSKQLERFHRYDHFLTQGWRQTRYATHEYEPALVFVCATDELLPAFLRAADAHLTAWLGRRHGAAQNGTYPGRDQTAFTSLQRINNDDWRMLQVPALPPKLRNRGTGRNLGLSPRTHDLPLPQLFG